MACSRKFETASFDANRAGSHTCLPETQRWKKWLRQMNTFVHILDGFTFEEGQEPLGKWIFYDTDLPARSELVGV